MASGASAGSRASRRRRFGHPTRRPTRPTAAASPRAMSQPGPARRTFGKKSAAPPPSVSAPPPPKFAATAAAPSSSKGPPLNRLARADLGAIESLRDDLEYALGGMRPGAALAARRRCALDVLDLVADPRRGATLLRHEGVAPAVTAALARADASDAVIALALACVLHLAGSAEGVEPGPDYVACAVRVLEPTAAAPPLAAADAAPLGAAWKHAAALGANAVAADAPPPEPTAEGALAARSAARRLCLDALVAVTPRLGTGAAAHPPLRQLEAALLSHLGELCADGAAGLAAALPEAEACLELLSHCTFATRKPPDAPSPSKAASIGGSQGNGDGASQPSGNGDGAPSSQRSEAASSQGGSSQGSRASSSQGGSSQGSRTFGKKSAPLKPPVPKAKPPPPPPEAPPPPPSLLPLLRVAQLAAGPRGGGSPSGGPRRAAPPPAPAPAPAPPPKTRNADPFAFGGADAVDFPSQKPKPPAPSPRAERAAAAAAHEQLLLLSLKVLINMTNSDAAACEELLGADDGVALPARVLASEFRGSDARGGLPRHFDLALMSVGLLTNAVEACPRAQAAVAAAPCALGGASTLLALLASVLRQLLEPAANGGGGVGGAAAAAEGSMEREVFAAYTALLLGFLCRGKPANCKAVLGVLGADDFTLVAQILRSFLELHSEAQLLSEEGSRAMTEIVDFLSSWRAE